MVRLPRFSIDSVALEDHFSLAMQKVNKELKKLDYIISLLEIEDKLPVKFIKFLRDGLYELRMEYSSNIYRVFFIFDEGQNSCPLQWISEEDTENTTIRN